MESEVSVSSENWNQLGEWGDEEIGEENLFGNFHSDRVSFHIVEDPNIGLHGGKVQEMTLYFIDDLLCRKKYDLNKNISSALISQYGNFKFKKLRIETDSLSQTQILLRSDSGFFINPLIGNYQLKWIKDTTLYFFRHEQDSLLESNVFIEESQQYQELYTRVEQSFH
ncbi:hypothetical protein [Reichenbachiella sp. 5M10]|uniref:hypothetical protein n=1 Tax=Reichenbachiella sp. 5M10 TaxID=1889772 RepID=UPI001303F4F5|nr:hypothetical protein [Reichenbachiella sp. 5M10]